MHHSSLLFLSNGHGEDLNGSLIVKALQESYPQMKVGAMPFVGAGGAYRGLGVPIIGPTRTLPSGGIWYMNPLYLIKDLFSGLIGLTWRQIRALKRYSRQCDLLVAVGDIVPIGLAQLTGRPYLAFVVSTSSYYEGKVKLPWLTAQCLRSPQCQKIYTRDAFTARDLQQQGFPKTTFIGCPFMDTLTPTGKPLNLHPNQPMIALFPGSRLPEALENFTLQLRLCEILSSQQPLQFQAALVPHIHQTQLQALATQEGWDYTPGKLTKNQTTVHYHFDAFPDILHQCNLVIGMAGTAVEQAVGLGKPIVQIAGKGPQFTYRFAEAQMRLLGPSITTVGTGPATPAILAEAAAKILHILRDESYLQTCLENGQNRIGPTGASQRFSEEIMRIIRMKEGHS
ncbi:lipid-A-disaccharide synthase-related protein [Roseofilum reptotaenium CS-1145]|uniref:Lipid-A-disaccharide synthase n=1 Tax=Roseofilum reptotaenium AO1-A TaxID=1925591 RepID=A0A1L9QMW2_9CYAN|nr:lipid-A-disaccharide synthase-related protein [Roseofilum reptotaenium]MDB9519808.1 lipid-A-disaccharide synthase-related protein [Roseofilum reptotaenium CS-1145]OJJ24018.1 hypothetical protein BI308_18710 [Roseofilum reptotaenium AO1-A]